MLKLLLLFSIIIYLVNGKHITLLFDTAISSPQSGDEIKHALKHAFDQYMLPQDIVTVHTFDTTTSLLVDAVSCNQRERIFRKIDEIQFNVGCADWNAALNAVDVGSPSKDVYLITDENPCKKDPTPTAIMLQKNHIEIFAIGIGKGVDKAWLKRVGTTYKWIQGYHYQHTDGTRRIARGITTRTETTPITTGEIVAASILGAFILLLIIISFCYACREGRIQEEYAKNMRNKRKTRV